MSDDATKDFLRAAVERNLGPMQDSAIFLSIYSQRYVEEPIPVLQFGLAMLLDKPIYILHRKGTPLAENVRKVAKAIEEYDSIDDFEYASRRLLARAKADLA